LPKMGEASMEARMAARNRADRVHFIFYYAWSV